MQIIRQSELIEIPWKNGGGITREIAIAREGDDVLWRLSMADVAVDGPFSNFSGLSRILTVIAGAGMDLETPQSILSAELNKPVRFDGALKVHSRLKNGPIQDFNLMFNPQRCHGDVMPIRGSFNQIVSSDLRMLLAVFCTTGIAEVGEGTHLEKGDTALIGPGAISVNVKKSASAIIVTITSPVS